MALLFISFVSLFVLGCRDSQQDDVFTGTGTNSNTGNVVFQFAPQAVKVPADTAGLGLDFFATADGPVIFSASSAFVKTVTVTNVPTSARFVVISAWDAEENPTAIIYDEIVVQPGVTNSADLGDAMINTDTFDGIDLYRPLERASEL